MVVSKLTRRANLRALKKKRQCLFVCSAEKTHLTQDPLAQKNDGPTEKLHVSFRMADHPDHKKKQKKTTLVPGRTLKSQAAESKTIPTETHGGKKTPKNCEEEGARKVVRLFGRGEAVFFWRNFERRFQFLRFASGGTSMLSADAPAARPIRLHPKTGFN